METKQLFNAKNSITKAFDAINLIAPNEDDRFVLVNDETLIAFGTKAGLEWLQSDAEFVEGMDERHIEKLSLNNFYVQVLFHMFDDVIRYLDMPEIFDENVRLAAEKGVEIML